MKVKVLKLGSSANEVKLPEKSTVQDALNAAGQETVQGYTLALNGEGCGLDAELSAGDVITLVPKVEGGRRAA